MNYEIYKLCPNCYNNKVELNILGYEQCTKCGYVFDLSVHTHRDSDSSTSDTNKYCQMCNTKLIQEGNWWICPNCHYGHMDYIGDPPDDIYIKSDGIGTAWGRFDPELIPFTLQIDTELIKFRHKEMELEFELEPDKLANIDTIIINGYKYVKE